VEKRERRRMGRKVLKVLRLEEAALTEGWFAEHHLTDPVSACRTFLLFRL